MDRQLPTRFWIEVVCAALGTGLFVLTLITREWFELLTGLDPDGGSGALEFALAGALLVVALVSATAARRDYVRAAPSS
ncbi:MAG TPA: hypothetical protein VIS05_07065 [Ilumatobacter sp.]